MARGVTTAESEILDTISQTAEVLRDGWYVTGDVATIDDDGFIQITDRLARLSEIGGEMVSHLKIEEAVCDVPGVQACVAISAPDTKKRGMPNRLLHRRRTGDRDSRLRSPVADGHPETLAAQAGEHLPLGRLPMLATEKVDLRKVKLMAAEVAIGQAANGNSNS